VPEVVAIPGTHPFINSTWAVFLAVALLFPCATEASDSSTGKVSLLHIGLAFLRPDHPDPVFLSDPKIDLTMVPAFEWVMDNDEIRRILRLYLPRNRQELAEYDLILIDGVDAMHLRAGFLNWVKELVQDSELNFVMTDSGSGWAFAGSGTNWYITAIEPILSVDDTPGREAASPSFRANSFRIVPVDQEHELMRNIPWEEVTWVAMNRPTARPGSRVVAKMSGNRAVNVDKPCIVYFEYPGGGRSVSYIFTWHTMVDSPQILAFYRWRWHYDVLVHMIYWPAGETIPRDLMLVHDVREQIFNLRYSRLFLISTMEFAERSGANLREVEEGLADLYDSEDRIDELYVENEMEECHELCLELRFSYERLLEAALDAKDRALLWVFVVEWAAVSGTSMAAGILVWSLLVRRRLYRQVKTTRLRIDL